ncbi:hypothetical protein QFZ79_001836 [Arthrobacter sp. V4I6]|uniref:hypothetical protein n=1 Tax=unclassified Arthrobacter TaxID=235627 RepID=UPI0027890421|nr:MULTISPECIES: hypothetical protein [unclassified Arthrobacter]MDQ0819544.1 hypothetical protein [Arthrobacter sp. V1I7]MDQ0853725.1 hypothetical protein [Arthrobacter sp. V4I6]
MTDSADTADAPFDDDDSVEEVDGAETAESIADDVRDEIRLGHVQDDVSHVLEERFEEAGIDLRPEAVDDLAEEIEKDASS